MKKPGIVTTKGAYPLIMDVAKQIYSSEPMASVDMVIEHVYSETPGIKPTEVVVTKCTRG